MLPNALSRPPMTAVGSSPARSSIHATTPRISVGLEYQRGDLPAIEEPLVDPLHPPPLARRLGLIGKAILTYERMRETPRAHLALAERLVRHL